MVGVAAAHIQRRGFARPAAVAQGNAGHLPEQLRQRLRLAALDLSAVDHGHRGEALLGGLRGARGGHQLVIQGQRLVGGKSRGKD